MLFNEEMDKYAHRLNANRVFFAQDTSRMDRILPAIYSIMQDQLTERQRACIDMYYFKNFNSTRIAEILGTSRTNVTKHIHRGLRRMEKSMRYLFLIKDEEE
ncbi:MAG: sigma-70 region 4 domain-containing protein [Clostridia bacterium]|nr:sigma-70 region 4 domain-containing protein [Clostridia bacterium]